MTNKALFFGYVAVLSVQFRAAAFCGVRQDDVGGLQGQRVRQDLTTEQERKVTMNFKINRKERS